MKRTQAQNAYRDIEEMIVKLELPPGSRISEKALSQQLGYGRTPVREALQRLAYARLVNILPRAGAIVTEDKEFPENSLIIGAPAKAVRTLTAEQVAQLTRGAPRYVANGKRFKAGLKKVG